MKNKPLALLAAFTATLIYGINHTVAKEVMPHYVGGFGFIFLRIAGATLLFWIVSLFISAPKIEKKDFPILLIGSVFGMGVNMLSFFKGLEFSTPINSGIIVTTTPIIVVLLSTLYLKEQLKAFKLIGLSLGLLGAILLLVTTEEASLIYNAPNIPLGNLLLIGNALTFGIYLVIITPLTRKYHTITLMKWMFLFGFFLTLPFTYGEFSEIHWIGMPFDAYWRIGFVVLGTTFLVYLLNVYALKILSPTVVSSLVYVQPVIAISFALLTGNDHLNLTKVVSFLLVIVGVYLVSKTRTA
ncbi:MAG: DMT family transporter [Flavobacteriaceae bacterium]|nr:DMT family transporter [Flavobacteriaceae bacterium]MCY4299631.1 DMT family transporter [Flavobacteriaceae bacterium]